MPSVGSLWIVMLFNLIVSHSTKNSILAFDSIGICRQSSLFATSTTGITSSIAATSCHHHTRRDVSLRFHSFTTSNPSKERDSGERNDNTLKRHQQQPSSLISKFVRAITRYVPLWTTLAACIGIKYNPQISPILGALTIMQSSLAFLMLAMGLSITPSDMSHALKQASVLSTNMLFCFGIMPIIALSLSRIFHFNPSEAAGIILLGSVSGGQASNLFTLLAGGDVALSVVCTFSTTLFGVIATPILVKYLLGSSIPINGIEVFQSIITLSLFPIMVGLSINQLIPNISSRLVPWCAPLGVLATLILVAGGASNTAGSLQGILPTKQLSSIFVASCLLPIIGGGLALAVTKRIRSNKISEKSRRALVIEIISKSPTLAYVLARKHFDSQSAMIPAASMVSLAVIGALVASLWSNIRPFESKLEMKGKTIIEKYSQSPDIGERAFGILLQLNMIEVTPDPDDPDYDHRLDNAFFNSPKTR